MSKPFQFDDHDRKVIAALQNLLWKLMTAKVLSPAKLISVAKVLHVLWHLPRPTDGVNVTINIGLRVQQEEGIGGGSSLTLSVDPELLNLECGESSYCSESADSEAWTTMFWSATVGKRTNNDGSWDESWLGEPYFDQSTINDLGKCQISIEDEDNELLLDEGEEISSEDD